MKYLFLTIITTICINAFGQVKVIQGDNSSEFKLSKQPVFKSFSTDDADYFVIRRTEHMEKFNTLIIADKNGNISTGKDIHINAGIVNNIYETRDLILLGNKLVLFAENHVKETGKNTLIAYGVDNSGSVSTTGIAIGSLDFVKMNYPGDWYTTLTPDKKHVAVIGKSTHEKDKTDNFVYFILDQNLNQTATGTFTFEGNTNQIGIYSFLASDKGDFYIVSEDFDKSYKYPVLYKYTVGGKGMIIPVMISDPGLKNLSYIPSVNAAGDLIIGGYMQKKKTFSAGDPEAIGSYLFNSSKVNEVKTFNFDKPSSNLTARNIVYNGDTFFLIGEQYKSEVEQNKATALARMGMPDVFAYTHNDIMVTAFANDGSKKFEMPISRKWLSKDFDSDLMVSSGLINNKLALIYNDQYGKYFDDIYRKYSKLPVCVLINNDGLMEAPVQFAKELDLKVSSYNLYPQFFNANNGHIMILSGNAQSVKTYTFK